MIKALCRHVGFIGIVASLMVAAAGHIHAQGRFDRQNAAFDFTYAMTLKNTLDNHIRDAFYNPRKAMEKLCGVADDGEGQERRDKVARERAWALDQERAREEARMRDDDYDGEDDSWEREERWNKADAWIAREQDKDPEAEEWVHRFAEASYATLAQYFLDYGPDKPFVTKLGHALYGRSKIYADFYLRHVPAAAMEGRLYGNDQRIMGIARGAMYRYDGPIEDRKMSQPAAKQIDEMLDKDIRSQLCQ